MALGEEEKSSAYRLHSPPRILLIMFKQGPVKNNFRPLLTHCVRECVYVCASACACACACACVCMFPTKLLQKGKKK